MDDNWLKQPELQERLATIECAGSERDRQRDRHFQELGIRVARFTGREIWRDAMACAKGAITLAEKAWEEGEYP